jgi:hypothetical protein
MLDWTIGYGYQTWRAGVGLLVLLVVGSLPFIFWSDQVSPANPDEAHHPALHPFLYTLDVLLPVVNLHQREAFVAHGGLEWLVALLTVAGWVLGTAAVVGLTGILKKD